MVVGAGFGQIPAIEKAKELGLKVVVTDKNPNAVGMKLADYSYPVDIIDKEGALDIAKKHNISGVMTMQSDMPVPTIGYINDCLGLKGVSLLTANYCSNKIETRKRLKEFDCNQPNFEIVDNIEKTIDACENIGFPCVIKAPDSSGSRGVSKVYSEKDIKAAFDEAFRYTQQNFIIVEQFIEGLEFGAQTFSVDGKCELVLLHSDILSEPPYMIPIGHSFPFTEITEEEKNQAIKDVKKAVEVLGIINGPANVDFILNKKDNRIKIIEIGARIGATCLPELVKYHTGIDWVEQTILNCMGMSVDLTVKSNIPVTAFILQSKRDGILSSYKFPEIFPEPDNLLEYEITAQIGEEVNKLRKGTDRIGKVVYKGENVQKSIDSCLKFIDGLKLVVNE